MYRFLLLALALTLGACEPTAEADRAVVDREASAEDVASTDAPAASDAVLTATGAALVDYKGQLQDGTEFDSGQNVEFRLQELISGMQDELVGMREGETKTFSIPPEEAYGSRGIPGVIPPDATLDFEVTVHEILR